MSLQHIIENHWYKKDNILSKICLNILLLPFSLVFLLIAKTRRILYKMGIFKSFKLPVPVVVIGNITVGGSGKTPLTKHIAHELLKRNIKVGVILRGYKSKTLEATVVDKNSAPELVGDEALIYANNDIPVTIGRNRYEAGLKLLEEYPSINIILSDDGMQHYRLQRDFEIAVIDENRVLGNKCVLPNGPLREPTSRLKQAHAIIVNSQLDIDSTWFSNNLNLDKANSQLHLSQKLILDKIYNPETGKQITPEDLKDKLVIAIAAIGNPQRFFKFITANNIKLDKTLAFPDHHAYQSSDIPTNYDIILTSDKDYTKLAKFKKTNIYVINVTSRLNNNDLIENITEKYTLRKNRY